MINIAGIVVGEDSGENQILNMFVINVMILVINVKVQTAMIAFHVTSGMIKLSNQDFFINIQDVFQFVINKVKVDTVKTNKGITKIQTKEYVNIAIIHVSIAIIKQALIAKIVLKILGTILTDHVKQVAGVINGKKMKIKLVK